MYFTLAIGAATREACAALVTAAQSTDPRVMPIAGPPAVGWQASDGRTAVLHWGHRDRAGPGGQRVAASHAGTIWIRPAQPAGVGDVCARTGLARVDPVYVAETPGAVVVSDRAAWAAAVTGRLRDHDPVMVGAFLQLGYPLRAATPFRRIRALGGGQALRASGGRPVISRVGGSGWADGQGDGAEPGGASRVAAALTAAGVPFRARTHGFASHPDVIVAGMIAERLGLEHTVTEPRPAATALAPDQDEVLSRLRSAVLISDGMLSAFENLGRPDPATADGSATPVQAGGHGGELLRGGYAQAAWRSGPTARLVVGVRVLRSVRVLSSSSVLSSAAATELFRRMTTRRLGLLRPVAAAAYLASLTSPAVALASGPLHALDDFYLVNRAGRWSAAARRAYLIRAPLVQPFFADQVVRTARAVPLRQRIGDQLHRAVLAELCPELLRIPLADKPWQGEPPTADSVITAAPASPAVPDWRRTYGTEMARFLRGYILDAAAPARCSRSCAGRPWSACCGRRAPTRRQPGRWRPWPPCCLVTDSMPVCRCRAAIFRLAGPELVSLHRFRRTGFARGRAADRQHVLTGRLRQHKLTSTQPQPRREVMMAERLTREAIAIPMLAFELAIGLGHDYLGGEHFLLALASSDQPAGAVLREHGVTPERVETEIISRSGARLFEDLDRDALAAIGIDVDAVRASVETRFGPAAVSQAAQAAGRGRGAGSRVLGNVRRRSGAQRDGVFLPHGPGAVQSLEVACQEAQAGYAPKARVEHLALGILAVSEGLVPVILSALGVSAPALRTAIQDRYRQAC